MLFLLSTLKIHRVKLNRTLQYIISICDCVKLFTANTSESHRRKCDSPVGISVSQAISGTVSYEIEYSTFTDSPEQTNGYKMAPQLLKYVQ